VSHASNEIQGFHTPEGPRENGLTRGGVTVSGFIFELYEKRFSDMQLKLA
jgi:hypothetical protein